MPGARLASGRARVGTPPAAPRPREQLAGKPMQQPAKLHGHGCESRAALHHGGVA
ncbi:MAG: hypothetical protein JW839_04475 [Candidatus Lokiarchaeota archaeon]|nr:hypothetical protein [Candidatus Lokiarchaeota archaeon]